MTTYTIVGGGAIGGTIAHALASAGHQITLIDQDSEHISAIKSRGLILRRGSHEQAVHVDASVPHHTDEQSLSRVFLAVKTQATAAAMDWISPRLEADGYVVSLQNGFNENAIASAVGPNRTLPAFVNLFADLVSPGVIADGGQGALVVGELDGRTSKRVTTLVQDLQAWGPAIESENVEGYLWSKAGFGAMLAATALADDAMAELLHRHRPSVHALAAEIYQLADANEVTLESFDAFTPDPYRTGMGTQAATDKLVAWLRTQSKTRSGIWRDIAVRRRPTEAVPQYEALLAEAEQRHLQLPVLRELVTQIHELERIPETMNESRLDALDRVACETSAEVLK